MGTFGPTVLVGLAGAALAAVAASRDWATADGDAAGVAVSGSESGSSAAPAALALALVSLAAWGALLVLRGRLRTVVAGLGLAASTGVLVAVADAFDAAQDNARDSARAAGVTGDVITSSLTGWYWASALGAALCLAGFAVAARRAQRWPEMSSRYDAPAAAESRPPASAPDDRDLWRAIDRGHDPTT
ncbi:hypothetical protein BH18ACT9_BH18ACT9_12110 [soil metagenome]